MKITTALPILAALAFSVPAALAEDAPPPDHAAMMAKHHSEMCANHYAHAVGKLAEIEVRLNLTSTQKTPFARWKDIKLAQAKAQSAQCADIQMPGPDASIIERRQLEIAKLQTRLDNLKAETPAIEALVKTLTPEQQDVLKRVAREIAGERMMTMRRFEQFRGPMGMGGMNMRDHKPTK